MAAPLRFLPAAMLVAGAVSAVEVSRNPGSLGSFEDAFVPFCFREDVVDDDGPPVAESLVLPLTSVAVAAVEAGGGGAGGAAGSAYS